LSRSIYWRKLFTFITDFIGLDSAAYDYKTANLVVLVFLVYRNMRYAYFTGIDTTISSSFTYLGIIKEQFATIN